MDLGRKVLKFIKERDPTRLEIEAEFGINEQELENILGLINRYTLQQAVG